MSRSPKTVQYLENYGIQLKRPLCSNLTSTNGIKMVVVIPALAEKSSLFRTLASIAGNPAADLKETLVLCVVNNHQPPLSSPEEIHDNQATLSLLEDLLSGDLRWRTHPEEMHARLTKIAVSGLRFGWIDASSPGLEIPDRDGGVGTARKIGMDAALTLLDGRGPSGGVIACLDADTLVEGNYLCAIYDHFSAGRDTAAVARYAHQRPTDPYLLSVICSYEIFLRAYVMGLLYAGSPYAFHAIGSTMACTAQAYVDVRGMNRRTAAEDFHFLNKLAKIGSIGVIEETTVFPSPRPSRRVPFGTGQWVLRFTIGGARDHRHYDPRIFKILRDWLAEMETNPDRSSEAIASSAEKIHPALKTFLDSYRFSVDWPMIRRNCPDPEHLLRQFHVWFDGLKTLRLVHHLSRAAFPPISMLEGLGGLLSEMGQVIPSIPGISDGIPGPDIQIRILDELRSRFPQS